MKFQVENRGSVLKINPNVNHVIISISDVPEDRLEIPGNKWTQDVMHLAFHDANAPIAGFTMFSEFHANKILDFYEHYRDRVDLVVAHCQAGLSRSPGVIAALQRIHTGEDDIWFKTKTPNSLVYRTILEMASDRGLL